MNVSTRNEFTIHTGIECELIININTANRIDNAFQRREIHTHIVIDLQSGKLFHTFYRTSDTKNTAVCQFVFLVALTCLRNVIITWNACQQYLMRGWINGSDHIHIRAWIGRNRSVSVNAADVYMIWRTVYIHFISDLFHFFFNLYGMNDFCVFFKGRIFFIQ